MAAIAQPASLAGVLPHYHTGKVRDTFLIPLRDDLLLMVASDRISTHNVVHLSEIPDKGDVLTGLTVFWTQSDVFQSRKHHVVAYGLDIYEHLPRAEYDPHLHFRAIVVRKRRPAPREFVYRNYLTGSLWKAYERGEDPYGLALSKGLKKMHRFDRPVFTPTMKSENDEPVSTHQTMQLYDRAYRLTHGAFVRATQYLKRKGIILIDSKLEADAEMILDEFFTPDSSRMAYAADVQPGVDPPFLDKEPVRIEAEGIWKGGMKIPLTFSPAVIKQTTERYHQVFEAITGRTLYDFQREVLG